MLNAILKEDILLKAACEEFPGYLVNKQRFSEFLNGLTMAEPLDEASLHRIYRHYCKWHQDKAFSRFSAMIRSEAPAMALAF